MYHLLRENSSRLVGCEAAQQVFTFPIQSSDENEWYFRKLIPELEGQQTHMHPTNPDPIKEFPKHSNYYSPRIFLEFARKQSLALPQLV